MMLITVRLMPYVLVANRQVIEDRIAVLSKYLGLGDAGFEGFLQWVIQLRDEIGIPNDLAGLGIDNQRLDTIGKMAVEDPSAATNPIQFNAEQYTAIVSKAWAGDL